MDSIYNTYLNFIRKNIKAEVWESNFFSLPIIQIHRGYHINGIQENTLNAFRQANGLGAKMCECDVQLSADQIPVIFHDWDLKRLGKQSSKVSELTAAQLKDKVHAPTLEEMLLDKEVTPFFNIELKSKKISEPLSRKVAEVVKKTKTQKRILFSSFNPMALWMIQNYLPEVPRALLVTQEDDADNHWYLKNMIFALFLKIHMLNLDVEMLDDKTIEFWKEQKVPISAWTVDDPSKIQYLLDKGITSVITNIWPH